MNIWDNYGTLKLNMDLAVLNHFEYDEMNNKDLMNKSQSKYKLLWNLAKNA